MVLYSKKLSRKEYVKTAPRLLKSIKVPDLNSAMIHTQYYQN